MQTKRTILTAILLTAFATAPLAYSTAATANDTTAATVASLPGKRPVIVQGKEKGSITTASFEKILKEAPDSIVLVDVRDALEFASGSFKNAINIPADTLSKKIGTLPADKLIIFFCGTGARSGEAYDLVQLLRPKLKAYFINGSVKFAENGSHTIVEAK
jgi:rhodanese-related sulfurtransferase